MLPSPWPVLFGLSERDSGHDRKTQSPRRSNFGRRGEFFDIELNNLARSLRSSTMQPVVPPELMQSAAQMVIYFVTVVAGLVSLMWTVRA